MISIGSFALLRPLWLLVLPALFIALRLTRPRDSIGDWARAIDAPLLGVLLRRQGGVNRPSDRAAISWGLALLALALSGPAIRSLEAVQFRNLDAALILLDVSRSETLPQAVTAAQFVLASGGSRQMGVVLYAGDAYLASPLTDDVAALDALLFAVDARTVPDGGSRPDRALAFARNVLRETSVFAGDIVLISDGEGVDARATEQAAALAKEGHALHTLHVTPQGAAADPSRREAMLTLAAEGGGRSERAARMERVAEAIAHRHIEHVARGARRTLEWRDYGRWLLLLAAAPIMLALRAAAS